MRSTRLSQQLQRVKSSFPFHQRPTSRVPQSQLTLRKDTPPQPRVPFQGFRRFHELQNTRNGLKVQYQQYSPQHQSRTPTTFWGLKIWILYWTLWYVKKISIYTCIIIFCLNFDCSTDSDKWGLGDEYLYKDESYRPSLSDDSDLDSDDER